MATSKKSTASKVRNTKAVYKTGKNEKAEALMKRSFEPLFSPIDGKARLTFCGVEHSIIEWTIDGKKKDKPVMKLAFSCFDTTHENPQVIAVTCDYRLSEKNKLGQILTLMGYNFESKNEVIDANDEYGIKTNHTDTKELFDFLRGQCGLVFKGNLKPAMRKNKTTGEKYPAYGLWDIDYQSLEPKLLKTGERERDLMSGDISDEEFENPEIAMASEYEGD